MKTKPGLLLILAYLGRGALLLFVNSCARAPEIPPKTVQVQTDDKMRFDVTAFEVKPGQKVEVTFKNIRTTPKFSMGPDLVHLDRSVNAGNVMTFLDMASTEAAHDYVPQEAKEVLAHSKLLWPNETDTITFNAPYVPGIAHGGFWFSAISVFWSAILVGLTSLRLNRWEE